MSSVFLRAEWRNLAIVSYAAPDDLLLPHLPLGCRLDRRDGSAFVSIVAFEFLQTRVLGVHWPGFVNFLEWNLRFYVRCGESRGVVFIREFIPSATIAAIANLSYNEPYAKAKLEKSQADHRVRYGLTYQGRSSDIKLELGSEPYTPADDSTETFFKEHKWGFGQRGGKRITYQVEHAVWQVLPVTRATLSFDWRTYGEKWRALEGAQPYHVMFALGSYAAVSFPQIT